MKHKLVWCLLAAALLWPRTVFGATDVPPRVVPSEYSEYQWHDFDFPTDPDQVWSWWRWRNFAFGYGAFEMQDEYVPYLLGAPYDLYSIKDWSCTDWPITVTGTWLWDSWYDGVHNSGTFEDPPPSPRVLLEMANFAWDYQTNSSGSTGYYSGTFSVFASAQFWSGGVTNVPGTGFFKLTASAEDWFTHAPLPITSFKIGSKYCDTNGHTYWSAADNDWYDATLIGQQNGITNYYYGVDVVKARLQIRRNGANIANLTNTVVVGEQIALTCQFVGLDGLPLNIAPITNFQWTVPSSPLTFVDYIANANTGGVARLVSPNSYTNSTISYHYADGANETEVICSVIVKGMTLTAKTKFAVLRPSFKITSLVQDTVRISTNFILPGIWMHFGTGYSTNPGIRCDPLPLQLVEDVYDLQWIQLVDPVRRFRTNSGAWYRWEGAGLDRSFPFNKALDGHCVDSPVTGPLNSSYLSVTADDTMDLYLMYTSGTSGAKMVPLRTLTWRWTGVATNQAGNWSLVSDPPAITPSNLMDANTTSHPVWSRNVLDNVVVPE